MVSSNGCGCVYSIVRQGLLQVLKDSTVDPMQALLPCYTLPGKSSVLAGMISPYASLTTAGVCQGRELTVQKAVLFHKFCMHFPPLGPLDVYLPDKGSHCETGKKLIHVSWDSAPLQGREEKKSTLLLCVVDSSCRVDGWSQALWWLAAWSRCSVSCSRERSLSLDATKCCCREKKVMMLKVRE